MRSFLKRWIMSETQREDRKIILMLLVIAIIEGMVILFVHGIRTSPDSIGYAQAVENMISGSCDNPHRNLRPLGTILALPFILFGKTNAFGIESFVFELITIPFFYLFAKEITGKKELAVFSVLLYLFSPIMLYRHIFFALTDVQTWCLFLLTIFFFNKEFKRDAPIVRNILIISLLAGISALMKENAGAGIIFMFFMVISDNKWQLSMCKKIQIIVFAAVMFALPIILNQAVVYVQCDYTYIDWLKYNQDTYPYNIKDFSYAIKDSFGVLSLLATFEFFRSNRFRDRWYVSLLLSFLIPFLVWSAFVDRFLFLGFLLIIPMAVMGLDTITDKVIKKINIGKQSIMAISLVVLTVINIILIL